MGHLHKSIQLSVNYSINKHLICGTNSLEELDYEKQIKFTEN